MYGIPPIYKYLKWPETNKILDAKKGNHWTFMGTFDRCKIAAVCQATELLDRGGLKDKDLLQLAFDLNTLQY